MRTLRRDFLKCGLAFGVGLAGASAGSPLAAHPEVGGRSDNAARRLAFANLHTGETFDGAYWERGSYLPDALAALNHLLRDFRTGEVHVIDTGLLDLLVAVNDQTGVRAPYHVISGYRSPATNAMLHAESGQVASKSLHMEGKAIDIRVPGMDLAYLRDAALGLRVGGVGYYPDSNFVHVDVGRVRSWAGS
jgi:uncharacterized protein YcbK (DUF882 family)